MVYVDDARHVIKRVPLYHMFADTLDELYSMAEQLELKREWAVLKYPVPFYDVTKTKRDQAIELGAKFITDNREWLQMHRRLRAKF